MVSVAPQLRIEQMLVDCNSTARSLTGRLADHALASCAPARPSRAERDRWAPSRPPLSTPPRSSSVLDALSQPLRMPVDWALPAVVLVAACLHIAVLYTRTALDHFARRTAGERAGREAGCCPARNSNQQQCTQAFHGNLRM